MIDTVMALWNHGSQYKVIRIFFTLSFICISVSLLLVTIVIPGYILFTQGGNAEIAATNLEGGGVSSLPDGGSRFITTQKPGVTVTVAPIKRRCMSPKVQREAQRRVQVAENQRNHGQMLSQVVPPVVSPSSLTSVRENSEEKKVVVASHLLYAGKPKGSVSHLQSFGRGITEQETQVIPWASATPTGKSGVHAHVLSINVPHEENSVQMMAVAPASSLNQQIVDSCAPH